MDKIYLTEVVLLTKSYNLQDFKDWLHWHLDIIEFDHCHIFDNESTVDIKTVCDSYGDKVSYEKIIGWPDQYALYNRYINNESKAWWVLPIDDDEFLYIDDKYKNITDFMIDFSLNHKNIHKLSIGWLNLFSDSFSEKRTNKRIIENTSYCHEAVKFWQSGDLPVKTFVNTVYTYEYLNYPCRHNPKCIETEEDSINIKNEKMKNQLQKSPTEPSDTILLAHYQFKSYEEWKNKCNLKSPGSKKFGEMKRNFGLNNPGFKNIWTFKNEFKTFDKIFKKLC